MEVEKPKARNVAAKLDMTLDDLIAKAVPGTSSSARGGSKISGSKFSSRAAPARVRGGGFSGRGRFGRRGERSDWSSSSRGRGGQYDNNRMEIDEEGGFNNNSRRDFNRYTGGGFSRNRQSDVIQKSNFRGSSNSWRGGNSNRNSRFESFNNNSNTRWVSSVPRRGRSYFSRNFPTTSTFDSPVDIDDGGGAMSDGEIPTTLSARRQLILEPRWTPYSGMGRRRRVSDGRMIRVSGLDYSILQSDLEELFQSVGPIERCWIDYDKTDRSLGTGGVIYESQDLALLAVKEYDRRTIDGQELRLELVDSYVPSSNYGW